MAGNQPFQNYADGTFNVGTDTFITIVDNDTQAPISLAGRTVTYKADPKTTLVTSDPIDNGGLTQHRIVYHGWTGTLTIDRAQGDLDSLQALMELNYYQKGLQKYFTIMESTRNQNNGKTDIYQFPLSVMTMQTSGERKKDSTVVVTLNWDSQQRLQIQ